MRELISRYRELCEQAVDPLEIAVALEDAGIDSAAAGRYRHADVFGLAEELFARVPRRPSDSPRMPAAEPWSRRSAAALRSALMHLVPVPALLVLHLALPAAVLPALLLAAGWLAVAAPGAGLVGRSGYGAGLALLLASPAVLDHAVPAALASAAALGSGSAEWSARWLRRAGRAQLASTTTLAAFRSRMRPALPVAAALQLAVVAVLSFAALAVVTVLAPRPGPGGVLHLALHRASGSAWAAQAALALLVLLVTVLLHCDRPAVAAGAMVLAAAAEYLGPLLLLLPAAGPSCRLVACGVPAVLLAPYAVSVLGRPGSYRAVRWRSDPPRGRPSGEDGV